MLSDYLKVLPQYLVPTHFISWLFYKLTRSRFQPWKNWLINWFIRTYSVDMSLAEQPDPIRFENFNAFFTRALRAGVRPLDTDEHALTSPVDGAVSQIGTITGGDIFQAKGHHYSLQRLLGCDNIDAGQFQDGSFATIYLSPRDYHRIHMPITGTLRTMVHVPGKLFSVNAATARRIPGLFARNERVVCEFDTELGSLVMVLVGALNVSRIDTVWETAVGRASERVRTWHYTGQTITLEKGAEMGRFNMGSTVILILGKDKIRWRENLQADAPVTMGSRLAEILRPG